MPRVMASALRADGWIKVDSYLWKHGDTGARFYPYNTRNIDGEYVTEWTRWHEADATPGSRYCYFTNREVE